MSDAEDTASVQAPEEVVDQPQVATTGEETSDVEHTPQDVEAKEPSIKEKMQALRDKAGEQKNEETKKPAEENKEMSPAQKPEEKENSYQANYKYKAFGKEKELEPFWRDVIKDPESEKKVKDLFTRADAFDDMKSRYENISQEGQKTLQQYNSLDRDVRRVTGFLNRGDYDNFFQSLKISDDQLLAHLQRKADIARLSPDQQYHYNQGVQARAENVYNQEQYDQVQTMFAQQNAEMRKMQLDNSLLRPETQGVASAFDSKMGDGAFRNLVIEEAAKHYQFTKEDLSGEDAVKLVLNKFGKLFENPPPQATVQTQAAPQNQMPQAPKAPGVQMVQGKPVIPNIQGRGTSPVKQMPKSLDDLKKMAADARMRDMQFQE